MSEALAVVLVACTAFVCASAVLVLRPLAGRLAALIDATTAAKLRPSLQPEVARLQEVLSRIDGRLGQLEERQDFAEALISASEPRPFQGHLPRVQERN